jgi:hypothetical protein
VPAAFDRVIARAMAKSPDDRYPSAGDLGRAALAAAAGREVSASERWVATGAAAGEAPRLMLENEEGSTGDLARRYAHEEETPRLGTGADSRRRRTRVPRALIFGLIGAAVGVGVFLAERPGDSGPSPELERLIRRADRICVETRSAFTAAAAGQVETFEQAARQVERQRVISAAAMRRLRRLDAPPEIAREWSAYLRLGDAQVRRLRQARDAAERGDNLTYQRTQRLIARGRQARLEMARKVGLRHCSSGA